MGITSLRIIGLDIGIASVGWCIVEISCADGRETASGRIIAAGTWMFDPPEETNLVDLKLKFEIWRVFRGQRRVIMRRRQRMNDVREILSKAGLLPDGDKHALAVPGADPWKLRVKGLSHALTPLEFALALGHIARHRGFKSNAKGETKNSAGEDGKMKVEIARTQEKLARYATPAMMLSEDEAYILRETQKKDGSHEQVRRFRNRDGGIRPLASARRSGGRDARTFQGAAAPGAEFSDRSTGAVFQQCSLLPAAASGQRGDAWRVSL